MKKTTIALALLMTGVCSYAQRSFSYTKIKPAYSDMQYTSEIGVNVGLTAFLGDLGGTRGKGEPFSKDLNGIVFRPHIGLSYAYYPQSWLKLQGTLNYTTITGADSVIKSRYKQSKGRYDRNLSFRSRVEELSVNAELYPLQLINRTHRETLLKPFVGVGVGMFHFNPKANLNGEWVELQPLKLEGQGFSEYPESKEYKLYQVYFPLSFGFKYRLDDQISIGFQATFRKTFTDYLDDVSNHEYVNPALFDKYLSADQATLAKQLYYRGDLNKLYVDGDPTKPMVNAHQLRSDGTSKDSYTTLAITFAYNLGTKKEKEQRQSERVIKVKRTRTPVDKAQKRADRADRRADRKAQRVSDRVIKVKAPKRNR